jgi:hypothetical protein
MYAAPVSRLSSGTERAKSEAPELSSDLFSLLDAEGKGITPAAQPALA